ncbi:TetR family transcriptional regulator C-terminal domain-containing protein [Cupriavidus sp. D39]|uniref:TetR family transcriptional regulator C-terminal domain-containing protein n=1 Tax=Cupriavidus sp. D39 TaxID=2997877 RepID=UPI003B641AC2
MRGRQCPCAARGAAAGAAADGVPSPPGCLLARSCAELVDLPAAGQEAALSGMSQQRDLLEGLLREAIADGELPTDADVAALAWYFLGVMQTILNLPQAGASRGELDRMIAVVMLAWPAAGVAQTRP